ncbi:MAG: Gfo/Idh/MocA family oxidoreductase [Candidatus Omnitrophica bacterium]|nr:Gfo/Idh/MocA family oxidoreductase [Candidatus Omnitrophota bacterium]
MTDQPKIQNNRRRFLQSTAGATAFMLVNAQSITGSTANSKIEFGIVGCGGRGNFIARKFQENAPDDIRVVAAQDPFADRLEDVQVRFDIDSSRLYRGLDAYHELMNSKLDAVAITSPPYFHPDQVEAAVAANKHVWMAKPVAADAAGCLRIKKQAREAKGKLNFLVDFQTRNSPHFKEALQRVHDGAIGDLVLGHIYYHAGRLGVKSKPNMSRDEARLRNWVFDIELSGDIIVEQNVHVLDVANWYAGTHPIKAHGTGGRKARVDVGDCWDHFIVTYWYPNGLKVDFSSAQFTKGYDDLCMRMYGSQGTADCHYNGPVRILGDHPWEGVDHDDTWNSGVNNNVKDFVKALRSGDYINHGDEAVQSTLTGVLGRMAAYSGEDVTWDQMMATPEAFDVKLDL